VLQAADSQQGRQQEEKIVDHNVSDAGRQRTFIVSNDTSSSSSAAVPIDISQSKTSAPSQSKLASYPKTSYGKQCRTFQSSWFVKYPWLEYSQQLDAVYCFCCRWFRTGMQPTGGSCETFVSIGYRNWQKAVQEGRGLEGHEQSSVHKACFHAWKVWEHGQHESKSIAHVLSSTQVANNRVYITYVADLVRFIVANEKPLRGTDEFVGSAACGFLVAMMERDFANNPALRHIADSIPRHCTYTSPDSQNDIIELWFQLLQTEIVDRVSQTSMYCVMADETRNRNNVEDMCVCVRYVDADFNPHECLVDIVALDTVKAVGISKALVKTLVNTVGTDKLVAQSYDGASVMSGVKGGVQKLVSDTVGRQILYIHCFAHRLHLVVLVVLKTSKHVEWMLELCEQLYNFFRRYAVAHEHTAVGGKTLKRLMPQRWTGHYDSVCQVLLEYEHIQQTLTAVSASRIPEAQEAAGLMTQITHVDFVPIAQITKELLDLLMPLNNTFQSESIDLGSGLLQIDSVLNSVTEMEKQLVNATPFVSEVQVVDVQPAGLSAGTDSQVTLPASRPSRLRQPPKHLQDFVVDIGECNRHFNGDSTGCSIGGSESSESDAITSAPMSTDCPVEEVVDDKVDFVQLKLVLLNAIRSELNARFGTEQRGVYRAAASLAACDFTFQTLAPLVTAANNAGCNIDAEMLSHEIPIAKVVFKSCSQSSSTGSSCGRDSSKRLTMAEAARLLHPPSHDNLLKLYRFTLTMALDTAKAERSFSTVKRLLTDNRRSMTHARLRNIVVLAHEKQILREIPMSKFVDLFKRSGNGRRLIV
jgi:hypothetical protein